MNRSYFDKELKILNDNVVNMGNVIIKLFEDTIYAMKNCDIEMAKQVMETDEEVNEYEQMIELTCMETLAIQQPVAGDLRNVLSTLKLITDFERIADNCSDICEYIIKILANKDEDEIGYQFTKTNIYKDTIEMAQCTKNMLKSTLTVFVNQDNKLALKTVNDDDIVDKYFADLIIETQEELKNNSDSIEICTYNLFIIKYLERIADHCTNICEWVSYRITGEHDPHIG